LTCSSHRLPPAHRATATGPCGRAWSMS